jgi:hypothetical protein
MSRVNALARAAKRLEANVFEALKMCNSSINVPWLVECVLDQFLTLRRKKLVVCTACLTGPLVEKQKHCLFGRYIGHKLLEI